MYNWIHFGENFIDIWGGVDFGPYSSQSFNNLRFILLDSIQTLLPNNNNIDINIDLLIDPTSDVDKIFTKMYSQYVLFRNKYS
jgi:hypothetical protein